MPKKQSQNMRHTCDGDRMKTKNIDKVLDFHSGRNIAQQKNFVVTQSAEIDTIPIPIPESTDDRPRQRSSRRNKKIDMVSSFTEGAKEGVKCTEGCGCSHTHMD